MARKQVGTESNDPEDAATKEYVDAAVTVNAPLVLSTTDSIPGGTPAGLIVRIGS